MESVLAAHEKDFLIEPLSLTVGNQANYVVSRRSSSIFSSVNSAAPGGVNQLKWNISSSSEWADPSTACISFVVTNTAAIATQGQPDPQMRPATVAPHCLFNRLQIRIGGSALIEDIDDFGRLTEQFTRLVPNEKRMNEEALGFGLESPGTPLVGGSHKAQPIPAQGSRRVYMKLPMSGIFGAMTKYLPLFALGGNGVEVILSLAPAADATVASEGAVARSQQYTLTDARFEIDMVQLDSQLQQGYSDNVLRGGSLLLHTKLWDQTLVYVNPTNAGAFDVTLNKSISRLATVFASFAEELTPVQIAAGEMYVNTFRQYPQAAESLTSYITIGSKKYPDFPSEGVKAHFWKLINALGIQRSLAHSVNADVVSYGTNCFVAGYDVEKCPHVMSSGENVQGGQEIGLHFKNFRGADGTQVPKRCWVALHHEAIIEIRSSGVHLLS